MRPPWGTTIAILLCSMAAGAFWLPWVPTAVLAVVVFTVIVVHEVTLSGGLWAGFKSVLRSFLETWR